MEAHSAMLRRLPAAGEDKNIFCAQNFLFARNFTPIGPMAFARLRTTDNRTMVKCEPQRRYAFRPATTPPY